MKCFSYDASGGGMALCGGPKMRPGYIKNRITNQTEEIDECSLMPTMCKHGQCMNTPGSFECQCDRGYTYDINVHQCIGKCINFTFFYKHVNC